MSRLTVTPTCRARPWWIALPTHSRTISIVISDEAIRVTDDGRGFDAQAPQGLGSCMLQVCLRWERVNQAQGVDVVAIIAVDPLTGDATGSWGRISA